MPPARIPVKKILESLSSQEAHSMRLPAEGELELSHVKEGIWILTSATTAPSTLIPSLSGLTASAPTDFLVLPIHQKVLRLMKTHAPGDLVEGKFEQFLSAEELRAFNELLAHKKVEAFKSSPKYNLGIYREVRLSFSPAAQHPRTASPAGTPAVATVILEKPLEEYRLDVDGFEVLRNEGAAKNRSYELAERLKSNEVKGLKTFDGFYYIILTSQLETHMPIVVGTLRQKKKADLKEIAVESKLPPLLVRMVLEFAKEEGTIIEKRKDAFAYVG
jgi:hypothetical protein